MGMNLAAALIALLTQGHSASGQELLPLGVCLQTEVVLQGADEPNPEVAVAYAMLKCRAVEFDLRGAVVSNLKHSTGNKAYAEENAEALILAFKVSMTADLLHKARGAYQAKN
tara:strand:- start:63 stop:401 length:339 start_codon:yes stop_codon:yes gene_type:complete